MAHISVNMLNEYQDYRSGLDLHTQRTLYSGGSGALPESPEHTEAVLHAGLVCLALTTLLGLYFVWQIGWGLLPIGLVGILMVYYYSPQITRRPLLCLLAPGLGFGPIMISGAYYILSEHYSLGVLLTSLIILFTVSNLLLLNQFPDVEADREAGRLNIPILLGKKNTARIYVGFLVMAYALLISTVYLGLLPATGLFGLLTLFLAIPASMLTLKFYGDRDRLIPALVLNVALSLSLPVLISFGLIWQKLW